MSIRDLYERVSELPIAHPDPTRGLIKARNIDEIKLEVRDTDCPVRLLLPSTEGQMAFVAIGTMTETLWRIRDLCLWQPVTAGSGIEQCADDMLGYIELYLAGLKSLRNPAPGCTLESVTMQMGPVPWATTDFWAVDTLLEIREITP